MDKLCGGATSQIRCFSTVPPLTHVDSKGTVRMVGVSDKNVTCRTATASCKVVLSYGALRAITSNKKGDVLAASRIAGIAGAKQTAALIPLCHNIPLDYVAVDVVLPRENFHEIDNSSEKSNNDNISHIDSSSPVEISLTCTVQSTSRTGVEMEAMCGVSIAALTLYDMCKAADKRIVVTDVQLERKTGGKSGDFTR